MMCRVSLSLDADGDVVPCEIKAAGNTKEEERKKERKRESLEWMMFRVFDLKKNHF